MKYEECLEELYSLVDFERLVDYPRRFDLSSYRAFLDDIGNPQDELNSPVIITGTKGKGSTAAILASCLKASGHRVGLYTSPHLVDVRERIRVNGEYISKSRFSAIYEEAKPYIRKRPGGFRTVFEVLTAIAFVHFGRERTDYSIVEVGMGGRHDATNVVDPVLSIVTPISLDHTHVLGGSLKLIAEKKMGVARPRVSVVSAPQPDEALRVIRSVCKKLAAELRLVGRDLEYKNLESTVRGSRFVIENRTYNIPLLGEHQVENAATAYLALKTLSEEVRCDGFENVVLKGRLQIVDEDPLVVVDAAHNAHSAEVLAKSIRDLFGKRKVTGVISMLKRKDHQGFARELSAVLDEVYATATDSPRSLSPDELALHFEGRVASVHRIRDAQEALRKAKASASPEGLVLVTGSFYLVGEVLGDTEVAREEAG